jgi:hypothetical protein
MEKEFVPYELALRMKQLGFDDECFYVKPLKEKTEFFYTPSDYDDFPEQKELEVGMPLYQQAFRWFRENYNLYCTIERVEYIDDGEGFMWSIFNNFHNAGEELVSYEEAELECLTKLIEIVEQNK